MILVVLLCALSAASFTLAKAGLFYAPPIFFVAVRMLIAGPILLAYCAWRKKKLLHIAQKDIPLFLLAAFVHIYLAFVFDLVALADMSSFKGSFLYSLSPFIAVVFSYHYFAEKLTFKKLLGLLIGFGGFMPVLMTHAPQEEFSCSLFFLSRAEFLMILSVIASVYGWTLVRVLVKRGYSPLMINGYAMCGGGMLALITSLIIEPWTPQLVTAWQPFLLATMAVIFVSNISMYNLYGHLLKKYTATFLSFANMLSPLFAAFFGWLFLSEMPTISFFISMGLVTLGLALFYSEELKQGYIV